MGPSARKRDARVARERLPPRDLLQGRLRAARAAPKNPPGGKANNKINNT